MNADPWLKGLNHVLKTDDASGVRHTRKPAQ